MLSITNMKVPPVKLAPNQKVKTWKFAAKYLWKERFTEDKAELGRWTRDELLDLGPTRSEEHTSELQSHLNLFQLNSLVVLIVQ